MQNCWFWKEFIERDFEAEGKRHIIENGLLSTGDIMVVGGGSKIGKSALVMNIGICLASGMSVFNKFRVPQKNTVTYLQGEIAERPLQDRLTRMMLGEPNLYKTLGEFRLVSVKGAKLTQPDTWDRLSEALEHLETEVLILDPLYKFYEGDENKVSDMVKFFDALDTLRDKHEMAVIVVHHHAKPSMMSRPGAMQLRGSSAIFDYGDTYLTLNRTDIKKPRSYVTVNYELRNAEEPPTMNLYRDPVSLWYQTIREEKDRKPWEYDDDDQPYGRP